MKIIIQLATSFALALWPLLMMTSVMIFDSPGSTDNRKAIVMALAVSFIPTIIGILYFVFGQTFWTIKPKTFLIITIVVSVAGAMLFGYPKLLINNTKGISSNGYFIKETNVYYEGKLIDAKVTNFQIIDQYGLYARDADTVFFRGRKIEGAKASSFKTTSDTSSYFTDGANIFYDGKIVDGSDAATFVQLLRGEKPSAFYKDKNAVYFFGKKMEGINPVSVRNLDDAYLVDAENAFYMGKKIPGASASTFEVLPDRDSWAKDAKTVYYKDTSYPNIDASTLEVLDRGYAKDKSKVYYTDGNNLVVVESANAASFKVTNWDAETKSEATDGTHYFVNGKIR